MLRLLTAVIVVLLLVGLRSAQAANRILSFGVEIIIEKSGDAIFTETLSIEFPNSDQHGFVRTLPRRIVGLDHPGRRVLRDVNFAFHGSEPIRYVHNINDDADEIRIGSRDAVIPAGIHTFTLQYIVRDIVQLGRLSDGFKIAIPGKWRWPIASSELVIRFPAYMQPLSTRTEAFPLLQSGKRVSQEAVFATPRDDRVVLTYPKALGPQETLWVTISMPKGFFKSKKRS